MTKTHVIPHAGFFNLEMYGNVMKMLLNSAKDWTFTSTQCAYQHIGTAAKKHPALRHQGA